MTLLKTKQMTFILGRLSGLPTIHAFRRQTTREKRVFVFFSVAFTTSRPTLQTFITITLKENHFHNNNNAYMDTHFLLRMSLNNG